MKKKKYNTIYCNLFAGPGSGKSTMMAAVFAELKWRGIDCEMVTEYAKDKVWEGSHRVLGCQSYIFGKQLFRLFRLNGKVQVVITDSPILLSPIYDKNRSKNFLEHVLAESKKFRSVDIFISRVKKYNPNGRMQTLDEARKLDKKIRDLLLSTLTPFMEVKGERKSVIKIADHLEWLVRNQLETARII